MALVSHLPQHGIAAPMPGHTVADLIDAYEKDSLPLKAASTQYQEVFRWLRHALGTMALTNLTPFVLRTWRDALRAHYQPHAIRRSHDRSCHPQRNASRSSWSTRSDRGRLAGEVQRARPGAPCPPQEGGSHA